MIYPFQFQVSSDTNNLSDMQVREQESYPTISPK